eukprot:scaffold19709_cov78-Skeletonema_dohrnii-CCMP3373.AAC.3
MLKAGGKICSRLPVPLFYSIPVGTNLSILLQVDNAYYAITKRGGALVCTFTQTHTVAAGGDGMHQSTSHDTYAFPAVPS